MISSIISNLKTIYNFFDRFFADKRTWKIISISLLCIFVFKDFAWAGDTTKTGTDVANGTIELLNGGIFVICLIAQPLVMLIGWLLSPDWTFGDIFGLRGILHQMWVLISNIVYIVFAFMLIAIAFMNIFSENKDYAIKTALPKLVVGIIMVPFTWFIVSATLSVSNLLTASVISLAADSIQSQGGLKADIFDEIKIPKTVIIDLTEKNGKEKGDVISGAEGENITLRELMKSQKGAYNLIPFYAYGIFKIQDLKVLTDNQLIGGINKVGDVLKKLTFAILFAIIFCVLVIAIAFALLTRIIWLWLFAIFSPLFALFFFFGKGLKGGLAELEKKMGIMSFISLAMVPVYVAAALSFGLIFLSLAMTPGSSSGSKSDIVETADCGDKEGPCQQFSMGGFSLQIWGNWNKSDSSGIGTGGGSLFDSAKGMISNVIINFIALIVLWLAVMAALNANEITKGAVKPIAEFGDSIGKLMLDAPKYIPLKIPGTDGKSISLTGMQQLGEGFKSAIETKGRGDWYNVGQNFVKGGDEYERNFKNKLNNLQTSIEGAKNPEDKDKLFKELMSTIKQEHLSKTNIQEGINTFITQLYGIKAEELAKLPKDQNGYANGIADHIKKSRKTNLKSLTQQEVLDLTNGSGTASKAEKPKVIHNSTAKAEVVPDPKTSEAQTINVTIKGKDSAKKDITLPDISFERKDLVDSNGKIKDGNALDVLITEKLKGVVNESDSSFTEVMKKVKEAINGQKRAIEKTPPTPANQPAAANLPSAPAK